MCVRWAVCSIVKSWKALRQPEKVFEEQIRPLPKAEREKKLAEMANAVQAVYAAS